MLIVDAINLNIVDCLKLLVSLMLM